MMTKSQKHDNIKLEVGPISYKLPPHTFFTKTIFDYKNLL